jgi:hypothetical protein
MLNGKKVFTAFMPPSVELYTVMAAVVMGGGMVNFLGIPYLIPGSSGFCWGQVSKRTYIHDLCLLTWP